MTPLQKATLYRARGLLGALEAGESLMAERRIAGAANVGRSVVRGLFSVLEKDGFIRRRGSHWIVRKPLPIPRRLVEESMPLTKRQLVKNHLIKQLSGGVLRPGQHISELALSRSLGVSTISVREALLDIQPLGVLTKKERRRWEVVALTESKISQLREFREMIELFALGKMMNRGIPGVVRTAFVENKAKTGVVLEKPGVTSRQLLKVDLDFHRLLIHASGNSFVEEHAAFIYMIIEFQFASSLLPIERARFGLNQHLAILDAILKGEKTVAENRLSHHLRSAEATLGGIVRGIETGG